VPQAQVRTYGQFLEIVGDLGLTPARVTARSLVATSTNMSQAKLAPPLTATGRSKFEQLRVRMAEYGDRIAPSSRRPSASS
jgi:hypothetical protein